MVRKRTVSPVWLAGSWRAGPPATAASPACPCAPHPLDPELRALRAGSCGIARVVRAARRSSMSQFAPLSLSARGRGHRACAGGTAESHSMCAITSVGAFAFCRRTCSATAGGRTRRGRPPTASRSMSCRSDSLPSDRLRWSIQLVTGAPGDGRALTCRDSCRISQLVMLSRQLHDQPVARRCACGPRTRAFSSMAMPGARARIAAGPRARVVAWIALWYALPEVVAAAVVRRMNTHQPSRRSMRLRHGGEVRLRGRRRAAVNDEHERVAASAGSAGRRVTSTPSSS